MRLGSTSPFFRAAVSFTRREFRHHVSFVFKVHMFGDRVVTVRARPSRCVSWLRRCHGVRGFSLLPAPTGVGRRIAPDLRPAPQNGRRRAHPGGHLPRFRNVHRAADRPDSSRHELPLPQRPARAVQHGGARPVHVGHLRCGRALLTPHACAQRSDRVSRLDVQPPPPVTVSLPLRQTSLCRLSTRSTYPPAPSPHRASDS